ncbi:hypothetical protein BCR34DRAFT_569144 [Clohesyomyces aquaticus]|uniref:BTB domain-containing protein n=1 Tax=Clohesyomyces aquaticus TaxID=1231657 RepID=A0A1Y1ZF62_9PLEO|nr:hypothetical protein BCR34DRAFT_569144 [Clohesyomyces aquaticus]
MTSNTASAVFSSPIITITVGPPESSKIYYIHKKRLLQHSGYFRGALSSSAFIEGSSGTITLSDIDPGVFEENQKPVNGGKICGYITAVYCFAGRFLVPALKKDVMNTAHEYLRRHSGVAQTVAYACESLPSQSLFCHLLVDTRCLLNLKDT